MQWGQAINIDWEGEVGSPQVKYGIFTGSDGWMELIW